MDDQLLNIAFIDADCNVLGPGKRAVVWVQGCNLNCKGCMNKHLQPFEKKQIFTPEELFAVLMEEKKDIEGVTITGGEPFLQAKGLSVLTDLLRKTRLSIQVYSGFSLEELLESKDRYIYKFLDNIDVLIDGRFEVQERKIENYKGSLNQRIFFFTSKYTNKDYDVKNSYEIKVENNKMKIIGFYDE